MACIEFKIGMAMPKKFDVVDVLAFVMDGSYSGLSGFSSDEEDGDSMGDWQKEVLK